MTICRSVPALAGGSIVAASAPGLLSTSVRHKTIFFTVAGMRFRRLTPPAPDYHPIRTIHPCDTRFKSLQPPCSRQNGGVHHHTGAM